MADIKKVKQELLEAFNSNAVLPDTIARNDLIDNLLSQYFAKQSHMPKEIRLEALVNGLKSSADKEVKREAVKAILDRY